MTSHFFAYREPGQKTANPLWRCPLQSIARSFNWYTTISCGIFTHLRPGIELTGDPSMRCQEMAGGGNPCAEQGALAPVLLLNTNLEGGSWRNTGPWSWPLQREPAQKRRWYQCVRDSARSLKLEIWFHSVIRLLGSKRSFRPIGQFRACVSGV